ncbi:MAG: adenylate/guanylate cyclase domain-containing protein [Actinomycetota bacterium]|nr:adenylate/guanylate cyclase domain-containing protein [Actinomycetota bacterium]
MSLIPTRYARAGEDSYVAYQVVGDGPIDLVYTSGWLGHVEAQWEYPALARFLERLASFSRLICFDRRGHGLSDPIDYDNTTLEQWMEDVHVVMDAAGSERAAFLGAGEGGPMTMLFAATYPERTSALALVGTQASMARRPDYPWGMPPSVQRQLIEGVQRSYWDPVSAEKWVGSLTSDQRDQLQLERLFRFATSPGTMRRLMTASFEVDVRDVLPSVRVPTLVLHRTDDRMRRVESGRHLAREIAGAKYVELPGVETHPWSGDQEAVLDEIQEFLTGVRPAPESNRVLATMLFTDVVASTEHAARAGDHRWLELFEEHKKVVRRALARNGGREVNTSGDGFLATFDGPARAVRCARAIVEELQDIGLGVRAGVHTGEIELAGDDVTGIAVHIGSRVQDLAGPGEVLVSRTVVDLVAGSGLEFDSRGEHELKGVPGRFQLFAVRA